MILQKQEWLGFSDEVKEHWQALAMQLCEWISVQVNSGKIETKQVANMWPVVWYQFLRQSNLDDHISLNPAPTIEIEQW